MLLGATQKKMASLDFFAQDTHTGAMHYLEFEKPLYDLEAKLSELQRLGRKEGVAIGKDVTRLQGKIATSSNRHMPS